MEKVDFKKSRKNYFSAKQNFELQTFPAYKYLMVDGFGDPNTSVAFKNAIELSYGIAYTIKFAKKEIGEDFVVPPMEALWWATDPIAFVNRDKASWSWTVMLMMPDNLSKAEFKSAQENLSAKKGLDTSGIRLGSYKEGLSYSALHIGSYDDEAPALAHLHNEIMPAAGYTFNGHHHEIYLSDARKSEPSKLKTILRQPVKKI